MTSKAVLGLALAGVVACIESIPEPEPPPEIDSPLYAPLGSSRHVAPPGTMPPDTLAPPVDEVPWELRELRAAVAALDEQGEYEHDDITRVLEALADALILVNPHRTELIGSVRNAGRLLESSPWTATHHADLVLRALDDTRVILASGTPRSRYYMSAYVEAIGNLRELADAIDPDRPLLAQHAPVVVAFEAALHALEVALGVADPDVPGR